eukprot:2395328-Rhodomonas_salina.1
MSVRRARGQPEPEARACWSLNPRAGACCQWLPGSARTTRGERAGLGGHGSGQSLAPAAPK